MFDVTSLSASLLHYYNIVVVVVNVVVINIVVNNAVNSGVDA